MAKAIDENNYYRIPCDERDLNYNKYFIEGEESVSNYDDYHSHNTNQLNINEMTDLLMKLDIIKEEVINNKH